MASFKSTVQVTFIDDATGQPLGVTEIPPEQLPETFALDTMLHLGNDDWSVVDAQPTNRTEYLMSMTLTLRLRRIEKIDPSQILYSQATICDRAPPLCDELGSPNDADYVLHEDEWRQIEFVPAIDRAHLAAQVAQLRQFKLDHWTGEAWNDIFVRPDHPTDFVSLRIPMDRLGRALAGSPQNGIVVFQSYSDPVGSARPVVGGFSFRVGRGTVIYGHHIGGSIASLAADVSVDNDSEVETTSNALRSLSQLSPLLLVDWNTDSLVGLAESEELTQWLALLANAS